MDQDHQKMQEERDRAVKELSTFDKIKYKNLESQYDVEKETGSPVGEDKHGYIMSRIHGSRYTRGNR
jgi:flagellar hook-associated protein FlgK